MRLPRWIPCLLATLSGLLPAAAGWTSLYAFGDGVCTTTDGPGGSLFYGNSYCNGRVWIEVLAQWQGLPYVESQNDSYFGHDSSNLIDDANGFVAPPDVSTALFIIWTNDADFVEFRDMNPGDPYVAGDIPAWDSFISQSLANHQQAVTTLYGKGVRTLVMPKVVNITFAPIYTYEQEDRDFIRERAIAFNNGFDSMLDNAMATLPGLIVYRPDTFTLVEDALADPAAYGFVNTSSYALQDLDSPALDAEPGASYLFWDFFHPTAKFQMHLADLVQRMISPPRIDGITVAGGTVELEAGNIPVGRDGCVDGTDFLPAGWSQEAAIPEPAGVAGTVSFPMSGDRRFYRLRFPVVWTFP
jgi:hypothetical protein